MNTEPDPEQLHTSEDGAPHFRRELGVFDSVMVVVGIMVGSGIFIVSAEMSRGIGSAGWLLVAWLLTGALTVAGALAFGELAAMMPRAGGMYIYLREAFSPLCGFLYGWTLCTVIQTGTIAAVSIAFARFCGVLFPGVAEDRYLIAPIHLGAHYALSLSTVQLLAVVILVLLMITNCFGLSYGKLVQNIFTVSKLGALLALIVLGLTIGANRHAVHLNFSHPFLRHGETDIVAGLSAATAFGLFVAVCISQTGSLFSADSWHDITFVATEVRDPKKNLPIALAVGTSAVALLYLLVNIAYLVTLPLSVIQHAPSDRVATATLEVIFPGYGAAFMAAAIMVSSFGTVNALTLAGARASYALARDRLFFRAAGTLNRAGVPGWALLIQGIWSAVLVLPRTYNPATGEYGNLYSNLLDYVISAALIFYILTIVGLFRLRRLRPNAERPYRAWGYPVLPACYILGAGAILIVLCVYRPGTSWPGLAIIAAGVPVYLALRSNSEAGSQPERPQEAVG
jgi:basic amino acid/polyamine antiporter, APA family